MAPAAILEAGDTHSLCAVDHAEAPWARAPGTERLDKHRWRPARRLPSLPSIPFLIAFSACPASFEATFGAYTP